MKNERTSAFYTVYFTAGGFCIGICLLIITVLVDLVYQNIGFYELMSLHGSSFAYILLYASPVLLALYGYWSSRFFTTRVNDLANTTALFKHKFNNIQVFIDKLKNNETDIDYEFDEENDDIGQSLTELKNNLKRKEEEEKKHKREDLQRTWINEGIAKFSDILRNNNDDLKALSFNVISKLVEYLGANQGAFFLLAEEEDIHEGTENKYFEMTGCYAYERKKYPDSRVEWGEGLIGTCAIEKETIYMNNVPETYVNITSGLGKATPHVVLIVPLKIEEEVHGVLEIASFKDIPRHQIAFVERIANNITSTLANVKANEKTSRLLSESRKQAEELSQNEEEMRQNMEELQTAKEETARQTEKFITFTDTVNHSLLRAEFDLDKNLLFANDRFYNKLGYSGTNITGKKIFKFLKPKDKECIEHIWDNLQNDGEHFEGEIKYTTKQGNDLWTLATYSAIKGPDQSIEKILFLGMDITQLQQQNIVYKGHVKALDNNDIKAEFTIKGEIMDANNLFINSLGYDSFDKFETKTIFDLIDKSSSPNFDTIWDDIAAGKKYNEEISLLTRSGGEIWVKVIIIPIRDIYGDINRILLLGHNITEFKLLSEKLIEKEQTITRQKKEIAETDKKIEKEINKTKRDIRKQYKDVEKIKIRNEQVIEYAPGAIVTFDHLGTILSFNKQAEQLWGYEKEQAIGARIEMLFSEKLIQKDDFIAKMITPGEEKLTNKTVQSFISTVKGDEITVNVYLASLLTAKEKVFTLFIERR